MTFENPAEVKWVGKAALLSDGGEGKSGVPKQVSRKRELAGYSILAGGCAIAVFKTADKVRNANFVHFCNVLYRCINRDVLKHLYRTLIGICRLAS